MGPVFTLSKKIAIITSSGLLGLFGYPTIKSIYPTKKSSPDNYVELPTTTADLTKDISLPETEASIGVSHWLLLAMLKSKNLARRDRALTELARQRSWSDAECIEIAQALDHENIIRLARTADADIRLFLSPPSAEFIKKTLETEKVDKIIKSILKEASENLDACSSCTNFYTNLSLRVRPDPNILARSELDQVENVRLNPRKRIKSNYNEDIIRLKAVLNNIICGEEQALSMVKSGILLALLYLRQNYLDDPVINGLLAQILANLSVHDQTKHFLFLDGWIQTLVQYLRSEYLELSMPASKALSNLDPDASSMYGIYDKHLYLLHPILREQEKPEFDVIFVHGLVGSVFKTWRQGTRQTDLDETTELLPSPVETQSATCSQVQTTTRCWPKDWLAQDIPNLRVLAVDYPTALSNWRTDCDINKDTLEQRAQHVIKQLESAKVGDRPIVWVVHSMGGLLVKQILILCNQKVIEQTKGVIFYSVPHRGSNLDWIERKSLQKLLQLTTEVIELQKDSPILLNLHKQFLEMIEKMTKKGIRFLSFVESSQKRSSFGVNQVVQWRGVLVHEESLNFEFGPVIKLNIDHAHTCKPSSKSSLTYTKTLDMIKELKSKQNSKEDEDLVPIISFIL